jgi:hypothetical protein
MPRRRVTVRLFRVIQGGAHALPWIAINLGS